jgi:GAF domain-containing protein
MAQSSHEQLQRSGVLFIDRSNAADNFRDTHQQALIQLNANPRFHLRTVCSLAEATALLIDEGEPVFSVIVLWLSSAHRDEWRHLLSLRNEIDHDVGIIVVFGFDDDTQASAREVMIHDAYAFACPFNPAVLSAYIEANDLFVQSTLQLDQFEKQLRTDGETLQDIIRITLEELRTNPFTGYQRATIDLIDTKNGDRYRLAQDKYPNPNRSIQRNIYKDMLIQRVWDEGVLILSDLEQFREQPERLHEAGWADTSSTNDICSWTGMILEHEGEAIGLITLDHTTAGHYGRYGEHTLRYLESFRRIVGAVISSHFEQRSRRVINEVTAAVSQKLKGRELLRAMLRVIRDGIGAQNCTFFRTESSIDTTSTYVRAWVSAKDPPDTPEPDETQGRIFRKGEGLAGNTLADGKSRIVPHALEDPEFRATPSYSGVDLSMLLVPMYISAPDTDDTQIIGVICANAPNHPDAFSPYDRALVEAIAQQVALAIQRTLILENIALVSAEINRLLIAGDIDPILRKICEHALQATTATEAVIHRLRTPTAARHNDPKIVIDHYWYPASGFRKPPRLDGNGATDEVLRRGEPTQFSAGDATAQWLAPELLERGVQFVLGVPLRIHEGEAEQVIGVLFLNKYAPGGFSTVEQFAIDLFASEAANAIYTLETLSGLRIWSRGNASLIKAIRSITDSRNREGILHNIVVQAHQLVHASFSYITLRNEAGIYEFQVAWPSHVDADLREKIGYFDSIHGNLKLDNRKGITGLAARDRRSIRIDDIALEQQNPDSEIGREYIDFGMESRSELAVPIMIGDTVLGVINVEHTRAHAFTEVHQSVVELLAEQAAIALQKNEILASHRSQNQRLVQLLDTLQAIVRSEPDEIVLKAVNLTPQVVGAEAVIWIPIEPPPRLRQSADPAEGGPTEAPIRIDATQILSNTTAYHARRAEIAQVDPVTETVFKSRRCVVITGGEGEEAAAPAAPEYPLPQFLRERNVHTALCLPLLAHQACIGVIWFDFGRTPPRVPLSPESVAVFQTYVSQIALAYDSAQKSKRLREQWEESHTGITRQIDNHYSQVNWQSRLYFVAAIISSVVGAGLVLYGGWIFLSGDSATSQQLGVLTAVIGVITEAIGIFVYTQARAAHERMDRYHQELYRLRLFEILLLAAEQQQPDLEADSKRAIIDGALRHWLERQAPQNDPAH